MKRLQDLERFEGDFSSMWRLDDRPPIFRLTWDWWWWLVMLDDEEGRPSGKQFMILWSTKDNDIVDVNSQEWRPSARPGADENGSLTLDGMVCAWWFDGEKMHDEIISEKCKLVAITDQNPIWPDKVSKTLGGGAVIPILPEDNSMGLNSDLSEFWIKAKSYRNKLDDTPESFEFKITPWNRAMSTARYATADYAAGMGYDILRLHGSKVHALIDGKESKGFVKLSSGKKCSPPKYIPIEKENMSSLPEGSVVVDSRIEGPDVIELATPKEVLLRELEDTVQKLKKELTEKTGETRWKLEFVWGTLSPTLQEYWDLKTEKEANDLLEHHKSFFARSLSESIRDIKIFKYSYRLE